MSADFNGRLVALRSLAGQETLEPARSRLATAAAHAEPRAAAQHVLEALPYLRRLPRSLQRLTWLETFGAPLEVRLDHSAAIHGHWSAGINRSCDGLRAGRGAARLLAIAAGADPDGMSGWLRQIASCEAFTTLLPRTDPESIAREGVDLLRRVDGDRSGRLAEAARAAELPAISDLASLAAWLHSLATPGSAPRRPPASGLAELALTWPYLRGLRRRGARRHAQWIGERLRDEIRDLPAGSERQLDLALPDCFRGIDAQRSLLAPLVKDLLSRIVAEVSEGADSRAGVRTVVTCCPGLIDESAVAIGSDGAPAPDRASRRRWLESLLGMTPLDEDDGTERPA